jgi:hypothetical protein
MVPYKNMIGAIFIFKTLLYTFSWFFDVTGKASGFDTTAYNSDCERHGDHSNKRKTSAKT